VVDNGAGADLDVGGRPPTRRSTVLRLVERLVEAIRDGDEKMVEDAVLALSRRSRWLAPLALIVGAFAMLFQGVKLLFINWRLTLVEILPAMWIWAAMLDLKIHVFHGRDFHIVRGPLLIPLLLGVVLLTAGSFYLNAVFAFAIAQPGHPEIRPAMAEARNHLRPILAWGSVIGLLLGFSTMVATRWGTLSFAISLSIVVGVMMLAYVAVPARLAGIRSERSRRDKLTATAVGGAIGALVCSPPYALGRVAILMLGIHALVIPAIILLVIAVILQTGATTATKAVKFSAKLITGGETAAATMSDEISEDALPISPVAAAQVADES
jgi:hypothetical protein